MSKFVEQNGNGKVTLAIVQTELHHLQKEQDEMKQDVKEIKSMLSQYNEEHAQVKGSLKAIKVIGSIAIAILGLVISVMAALK